MVHSKCPINVSYYYSLEMSEFQQAKMGGVCVCAGLALAGEASEQRVLGYRGRKTQ